MIRTSDGAEAGHIEYIVVDPSSREVISTVVSGGVEGDRLLAIPYSSLNFAGGNEITLTEITRERLVSAPVIERTQINTAVIAPEIIERTREHFGARGETNVRGRGDNRVAPEPRNAGVNGTIRPDAAANGNRDARDENQPPRTTNARSTEDPNVRREEGNRSPNRKNANAESSNGTPNGSEAQSSRGRNLPSTNSRNDEGPSAEGGNKTPSKANSRENTPAERAANGEKPADQPANNAASERVKKQNEERGAAAEEKAAGERQPQGSRPEGGARSLDEAPTNSPSSRAKKAGEENSDAAATKHAPQKSPSSTEEKEKRNGEPRSPQF
jgi:hypothetical protein